MDLRKILEAETFLILTHVRPDGDAISSSLAFWILLVSLGKKPENIEVFVPFVSKDLSLIDKENVLKQNCVIKKHDLVIILDCSDYSRIEGLELLKVVSPQDIILIDHHEISENLIEAETSVTDATASSCTCILYREFYMYVCEKDRKAFLNNVAIGIMSDTISLTLNVTAECKEILSLCQKKGIDIRVIGEQLKNIDITTQRLANISINRLVVEKEISCTYILQQDLKKEECTLETLNHKAIIQQILASVSCKTLILLIENDNHEFKGSMRTIAGIDLNEICGYMVEKKIFLQGGGHSNSAGFKVPILGTTLETVNQIFRILVSVLSDC